MSADLQSIDAPLFRAAMRRVASSVTVVTTTDAGGIAVGMTATAICSLSTDPPSLLAVINKSTWLAEAAPRSGCFSVNLLSETQAHLARVFAGMTDLKGSDRFSIGQWQPMATGAPLLHGALAGFDCVLEQIVDWTSHTILIGRVVGLCQGADGPGVLLYSEGHFGKLDRLAC